MPDVRTFSSLDVYLVGYLSLNGFHYEIELRNGKAVFIFEQSDDLYRHVSLFNSNEPVNILDFTTQVKMARGRMLAAKENAGNRHGSYKR